MLVSRTRIEQKKYASAAAIAHEALSSIETVHGLTAEFSVLKRYEDEVEQCRRMGVVKYAFMLSSLCCIDVLNYLSFATTFWYGSCFDSQIII